jgi:Tfp pilus assembly protein FimV
VIAAEQKARAEAAANAANLKAQLDDLARQKAASDADLAAAQALIDAAPQDAKPDGPDAPAPAVILDAIRGK